MGLVGRGHFFTRFVQYLIMFMSFLIPIHLSFLCRWARGRGYKHPGDRVIWANGSSMTGVEIGVKGCDGYIPGTEWISTIEIDIEAEVDPERTTSLRGLDAIIWGLSALVKSAICNLTTCSWFAGRNGYNECKSQHNDPHPGRGGTENDHPLVLACPHKRYNA